MSLGMAWGTGREKWKGNGTGKESKEGQGWGVGRKRGEERGMRVNRVFSSLAVYSATDAPWLTSFLPLLHICLSLCVIHGRIKALIHLNVRKITFAFFFSLRVIDKIYSTRSHWSNKEIGWMVTTPFVWHCVCMCSWVTVVVPLGGWISRRMAIILISTNYVCFQLTKQLAVTSLAVFPSHAPSLMLSLVRRNTPLKHRLSQLLSWRDQLNTEPVIFTLENQPSSSNFGLFEPEINNVTANPVIYIFWFYSSEIFLQTEVKETFHGLL